MIVSSKSQMNTLYKGRTESMSPLGCEICYSVKFDMMLEIRDKLKTLIYYVFLKIQLFQRASPSLSLHNEVPEDNYISNTSINTGKK